MSKTPIYPDALAFRDPTHVNFITDETFVLYFDDLDRLAAMYGFRGAFHVVSHERRGPYLHAVLQKVPVPEPLAAESDVKQQNAKKLKRRLRRLRLIGQRFVIVRWCLAKIGLGPYVPI